MFIRYFIIIILIYANSIFAQNLDSIKVNNLVIPYSIDKKFNSKIKSYHLYETNDSSFNKFHNKKDILFYIEQQLKEFENTGYPFAKINFDNVKLLSDSILQLHLKIDKGKLYRINDINLSDDKLIKKKHFYYFLGLKEGGIYNEKELKKLSQKISNIKFLRLKNDVEVEFYDDYANLLFDIKKQNASSFNGVIGLSSDAENNGISINGQVDLMLNNALKTSEELKFDWQSLDELSQELSLSFDFPFIYKNAGLGYGLQLFKKDTNFLSVEHRMKINYTEDATKQFCLFYNNFSSISLNSADSINSKQNEYGLIIKLQNLDYIYNPRKGFILDFAISQINRGGKNNNLFCLTSDIQYYTNPFGKFVLAIKNQLKFKSNFKEEIKFNENELFRFGGLDNLRGVKEKSIYANSFNVSKIEARWLLNKNSAAYIFYDFAFYERKLANNYLTDSPMSLGLGFNFDMSIGIFSLNYSINKRKKKTFNFNNSLINFG